MVIGRNEDAGAAAVTLDIVVLGASAGGLDALKAFFAAARPDPRVAFVVITHLPATHSSHLAELLGRAGPVSTRQALGGERLEGGTAYVQPPGRLMSIKAGVLIIEPETARPPSPKPIDFFMMSLAAHSPERCVGIVLSGTDHDGTPGLQAIRAAGGLALVQRPDTAQFPQMPSSAIEAGVADQVLAPQDMPEALQAFLQHAPLDVDLAAESQTNGAPAGEPLADRLNEILSSVLEHTGHDFRWYRPAMLGRRLRRRMGLTGMQRVQDYLALLERSREEAEALKREFLIGVTDFFRDSETWLELGTVVLPALIANRRGDDPPIRVWTPGCATGEESYSIAMLLQEQFTGMPQPPKILVFGTDIDLEALKVARSGSYPESIAATVGIRRLERFFDRQGDRYVVRKQLRDSVVFAPHNLVQDTPFSRLDLILCRNVLIYFETALQETVLETFHYALRPQGYLLLGKAESLGAKSALFEPVSRGARLFRRLGTRVFPRIGQPVGWRGRAGGRVPAPLGLERTPSTADILQAQIAGREPTAAVLVDLQGHALHFLGRTAQFLEPQGDASLDLLKMAHPAIRSGLRTVLGQAISRRQNARHERRVRKAGQTQQVCIDAEPVTTPEGRGLIAVLLTATPSETSRTAPQAEPDSEIQLDSEREIDDNRRELSLALDAAERSNEELRIANEETLALNEELQSSNEELESSKEELQSVNEELATVNAQLEDKIGEITRSADDLTNLFASTRIATILLDVDLRIRRFTPAAAEIFTLQAGDEGRPLSDISSRVDDPGFAADLAGVLESQDVASAELRNAGGGYLLRRIQPYRTLQSTPQGVVVTYFDVTPVRNAAQQLRQLISVLQDSNDAVIVHEADGKILSWNEGAERIYGLRSDEAALAGLFSIIPEPEQAKARTLIERALAQGSAGPEYAERLSRSGRRVQVSLTISALHDDAGRVYALLSTERDITERLRQESEIYFRRLADRIPALLRVEDPQGQTLFLNQSCVEFTGQPTESLQGTGWLQYVHPEDLPRYLDEHERNIAQPARFDSDIRMRRSDGTYRWMRSISVPHLDRAGVFLGHVALAVDVHERKQFESDLASADRRKDEYLAMLAHELRNPLAPIRNAVFIISQLQQPDPRTAWATGIIQRQTDVLARLLDDLLDVARISRGKTKLELTPLDLSVLVERAVEISRPLIEANGHHLTVRVPPEAVLLEGDLLRLTQVLANLLNNAAKFTDSGGEIAIEASAEADNVLITVSDNGMGLTPEMVPRVFDLFAQADRTLDRSVGGLGLGLTLAKQLVELHHGSISANSDGLGHGSHFIVRLPRLLVKMPAVLQTPAASGVRAAGSKRILVVDSHEDAASSLAVVLRAQNHEVEIVRRAAEAQAIAERWRPEVVILDVGSPATEALQIARGLRGRSESAGAVLIGLLGYGQSLEAESAVFDHQVVKPADPARIIALVAGIPAAV